MSDSPIRIEHRGTVAVVTLDDPRRRNALTAELLGALAGALESLDREREVAAAVITGGPSQFAAGADVRELLAATPSAYAASPRPACWDRLGAIGLPLVAGVAGPALGGGCELAFLADLVVAGDNARFGQPEVRLGLLPGAGGTQRWARAAGRFAAAEVVLAGRTLDAFEARDLGLVARVVPAERVVEEAVSLASDVAAGAPLALRAAKGAIRRAEQLPLAAALEHERAQLQVLLSTDDRAEGITALLEKRAPTFAGR